MKLNLDLEETILEGIKNVTEEDIEYKLNEDSTLFLIRTRSVPTIEMTQDHLFRYITELTEIAESMVDIGDDEDE